jgi:dipeptidyl aminopeptidase/acylaminoacyl peptidase
MNILRGLATILLSIFSFSSFSQENGDIIHRGPVIFPGYSTVKDISWYYPESQYQSAITDKKITYEKITYSSDSLNVIAYLTTPSHPEKGKYPVVIFNRGSYVRNDIAFVHAPLFRMLVQNGFIVIAPALRGSEGGEGKDELGGRELADIMHIESVLNKIALADQKNVFMLGESRGGIMTFQAIRNGYPMRAAATVGAITDLLAYVEEQKWEEKTLTSFWGDFSLNKKRILENRSVLSWYDDIDVPILLLHGGKDPQVKPDHALLLAQKFSTAGKTFQLVIFSDGNHILSGADTDERDRQIVNWFKKHLNSDF